MATLFPDFIESVEPSRPLLRHRECVCDDSIRKVKGEGYQLRFWIGPKNGERWYSINGGCYPNEERAIAARKAVRKGLVRVVGPLTPLAYWLVMRPLVAQGVLPSRLLPMWVFRRRNGRSEKFEAKVKIRGVTIVTKLYATPEKAHETMVELLAEILGTGQRAEKRDLAYWWSRRVS